jgi:hypothetical protein
MFVLFVSIERRENMALKAVNNGATIEIYIEKAVIKLKVARY